MANDLVAYSRAGDVFHYRWAARRCLRLIYPKSPLLKIYIEGSEEPLKAGEYVIDVSEYYGENNDTHRIDYYQLKHTTVNADEPFTLSDLADTFEGFAARYLQHKTEKSTETLGIAFTIITNRPIAESFKTNLTAIVEEKKVDKSFQKAIEKYTNLTGSNLIDFCTLVHLEDSEGDYSIQKQELRVELSQLIAGSVDNAQIENLVALVQEKVLPDSNGLINREEVLRRFNITSERELYPAPAKWENLENIIVRRQYETLIASISSSQNSVIIHAAGGVGKSVFCQHLINSLPEGSLGIAYDCFGAGSYRNRSEARHKHRDALVQIINELAAKGLCEPLIAPGASLNEDIMRKFLARLEAAIGSLKNATQTAQLFILIDAADNAEMAANEYSEPCFANELLRESIPEDCRLIFLCRTERIDLLQPQSTIAQFELEPFSEEETLDNIRKWFPTASELDGTELHRLTDGNPRVQANALDVHYSSTSELLVSLGPSGTSVEQQIESQLNLAIEKIKDQLPKNHHAQIVSICQGLASLPPHIPIDVLSKAANVSCEQIRSFVSDIGRSLWLSDTSIQFRDEPTETWFRKNFLATKQDYETYLGILEPIAVSSSYVAEVLPQLYLQSEQHEKLIRIALSNELLPENNPIDARNVRLYRLQFAFKAALRLKNFKDAAKLAMRAGEEVAGNQRQLDLFLSNVGLIPILQSKEKVQEIAYKRQLQGSWDGSENAYSASLLSSVSDFRGEARGYLRAALNWLVIYYDSLEKETRPPHENHVSGNDILELAYAHFNIFGVQKCVDFLKRFTSKAWIFNVVKRLARRLIDIGDFESLDQFLDYCTDDVYFTVAVTSELMRIGKFPREGVLDNCLDLLCSRRCRIRKPTYSHNEQIIPGIVSFTEACVYRELSTRKILRVLRYYVPDRASQMVSTSYFPDESIIFFKTLAVRKVLSGDHNIDIDSISPAVFNKETRDHKLTSDIDEFSEVVNSLFPWYLLRAQILHDKSLKLLDIIDSVNNSSKKARNSRYKTNDRLPGEIMSVCLSILTLYGQGTQKEIAEFYDRFLQNDRAFTVEDKLTAIYVAHRSPHLEGLKQQLESDTYKVLTSYHEGGPEEIANRYMNLARAVVITSRDDAGVYFNDAINIVSKYGDEIVSRWEAITSLAEKYCEGQTNSDELAYRFIRCAELVGETVSREKYWRRGKAVRLCVRMSPGIGLSALSRWRDRNIGDFEYQTLAGFSELVRSNVIPPKIGWALTRFISHAELKEFLSTCIEIEPSREIQQSILDDAVHLLQMEGVGKTSWRELNDIAGQYKLSNSSLDKAISFFQHEDSSNPTKTIPTHSSLDEPYGEYPKVKWDEIFEGLVFSTPEGFKNLIKRYETAQKKDNRHIDVISLLRELLNRLEEKYVLDFVETILLTDEISRYDVEHVLSLLVETWSHKASFRSKFPDFVYRFGMRYSHELTEYDSYGYAIRKLNLDAEAERKLKEGILFGLAHGDELSATNFFGFVNIASGFIESTEAMELMDYSLKRFEEHIDEDFGDGKWNDSLQVSKDINNSVAGFIWSALGSPRSEMRWKAVHCVRKLAEINSPELLDSLINWLQADQVEAFGSHKFPFYNLHARLYFFIAIARVCHENPEVVHKYSDLFLKYAFEPHVLIQKASVEIILGIEKAFPGTYEKAILASVENIGKSSADIREEEYDYSTNSYWHENGEVDTSVEFSFSWDFDRYWYQPLGDVFGIPGKQIEDLAANVIVKEWGLSTGGYGNDPRVGLWNRSGETRHSHGSYPRTDDFDFYMSYHAMLVVAARLIEKMPVIKTNDWKDHPWTEWVSGHFLTREDGKWLSDCRDPLPLDRPRWISEEKSDSWKDDIQEENFLNCVKGLESDDNWITVKGAWHERSNERTETFSISTSLVSTETSNALLRALATCSDPYDYKLPDFDEERMEINSGPFQLKGWITSGSDSKGIDEYDPYADQLNYPPYSIGDTIRERMNLTASADGKIWYDTESSESALMCQIWSSDRTDRDEESDQLGMQLKASLPFLKKLCEVYKCDLLFEVSIKREIYYKYDRDGEYTKPKHLIFLMSADGKFRTSRENNKLG